MQTYEALMYHLKLCGEKFPEIAPLTGQAADVIHLLSLELEAAIERIPRTCSNCKHEQYEPTESVYRMFSCASKPLDGNKCWEWKGAGAIIESSDMFSVPCGDRIRAMSNEQMSKELFPLLAGLLEDGIPSEEYFLAWLRRPEASDDVE